MLEPDARDPDHYIPWAGHSARHALPQIYDLITRHKTTLVFVNTRSQAEMIFQELWRINELTVSRSRCITARSMSRSAARSRTR